MDIISNQLRKQNAPYYLPCLSIKDNGIHVNDFIVVTKKATLQYANLELLMEHMFQSHVMNRPECEYLSVQELILRLEQKRKTEINQESQIRRPMTLLIEKFQKIPLTFGNSIIEVVPWKGYRLNPKRVKLG